MKTFLLKQVFKKSGFCPCRISWTHLMKGQIIPPSELSSGILVQRVEGPLTSHHAPKIRGVGGRWHMEGINRLLYIQPSDHILCNLDLKYVRNYLHYSVLLCHTCMLRCHACFVYWIWSNSCPLIFTTNWGDSVEGGWPAQRRTVSCVAEEEYEPGPPQF